MAHQAGVSDSSAAQRLIAEALAAYASEIKAEKEMERETEQHDHQQGQSQEGARQQEEGERIR